MKKLMHLVFLYTGMLVSTFYRKEIGQWKMSVKYSVPVEMRLHYTL